MGPWKMTWAKAEKGLERMMKLFRGWYLRCPGFERVSLSTSYASGLRSREGTLFKREIQSAEGNKTFLEKTISF